MIKLSVHHSEFEVLMVEFMKACRTMFTNGLLFLHSQILPPQEGS